MCVNIVDTPNNCCASLQSLRRPKRVAVGEMSDIPVDLVLGVLSCDLRVVAGAKLRRSQAALARGAAGGGMTIAREARWETTSREGCA